MADETVEQPDPVPVEDEIQAAPEETLPLPDDRPAKNALAEMQRKYTKIERQNAEILAAMQAMAQQQQTRQAPPQVPGQEYSDEQLGQLAAAGNAEAIRLLVERQTTRQTNHQFNQMAQMQTLQQALQQVFARYPMLRNDPNHPSTQAVYQARQAFLASGWRPGLQTDLEAIKAAIVNAPHLFTASGPAPQDTTRRAGVTAQQSMEGAASRRSPQSRETQPVRPLDKKVAGIAQRMDVKDPQGSIKRFLERQQGNRSTVSPIIQQAVREEQA